MASQITSLTFVYSTVYSGANQRKHQSSEALAFVRGIYRWIPRTKGQLRGKCFHLMMSSCHISTPDSSAVWFQSLNAVIVCWCPALCNNSIMRCCIVWQWLSMFNELIVAWWHLIWWHKSGSALAQIMAFCLTAPSYFLNQCLLVINNVQWHLQWQVNLIGKPLNLITHLPRSNDIYLRAISQQINHWN